ncbi:LacI family DNA-binding transcriptional regulator [Myceligenerans crystallogenes]|uniref:LacI family DNA-binding transcriptional regulator n=1 Tax=Myceligenerans crystallogenes TaxID=316335 RepID=UPI0031D37F4E
MSASRPNSHDVARAAGVSQSTVSYALSGKGTIAPRTRERVLAVAAELGYRPNLAARSMRTRRSGRVAVVTSTAAEVRMSMLSGAAEAAVEAGYAVDTHSVSGAAQDRTDRVVELARSGQVEGVLTFLPVVPDGLTTDDGAAPVVAVTALDERMRSTGELADASLLADVIAALVDARHRRFLHVGGPADFASARARRDVYVAETGRHDDVESLGEIVGTWSPESGREAILALPDDAPPLAVIAANDHIALGVMRGASERGWQVPGDVVVTGWDGATFGAYTTPALTTITVDFREAGARAMRRLIAAIRDEPAPTPAAPLQQILWRESTGPARS